MVQKSLIGGVAAACALALAIFAGWAWADDVVPQDTGVAASNWQSGFLPDYSQLKEVTDSMGNKLLRWVSPDLNRANYQKILLEKVTFYPEPRPSDQVSMGALNDIRNYLDANLRQALDSQSMLTDAPGVGVLKLKVAITAVVSDQNLKPYQYIPIAFIFTQAKDLAGNRSRQAKMYVETMMTDSVSGEKMLMSVREGEGAKLKNNQTQLTLESIQPKLDQWIEAVQKFVAKNLQ